MRKILLVFLSILFITTTFSQPGSNDPTFNPTDVGFGNGDGANNIIRTTAIQSDGKIIIGGDFTSYNGTARNYIARLNADGTIDATFNPGTGANSAIYTTALQSDGKIIIGGYFNDYNGTARNRIARLNADGTIDATFNPGTGANNGILTTALQSDGKIIIGGFFTDYNGTARNRIARLNADGTIDATFNPGTGANNAIVTIAIQSDGKIIIGGGFTNYNGTARNYIARLNADGTLDATFNPGTGASSTIWTTALQNDGKIIIGGSFTTYNGNARNMIARVNADGTIDATFNPGTGANNTIQTTALQSDGKIIIGGFFTTYNGTARNKIARLNADGSLDATFDPGPGADNTIYTTALQSNGKIIIGGFFTTYNGISKNYIARLNADGTLDANFNPGTGANSLILTTAIQSDGKIIIGGDFSTYNGTARNSIARLNADGTLDATFDPGTGVNSLIRTSAIQSDGKIIIGGDFTTYNGLARSRIARLNADGTIDASFNPGAGVNSSIRTTALQSDGKIIIGGNFSTYNGTGRNNIARVNADGTIDATFNPGTGANNGIYTTAIQSDGKIIIGGVFTDYNGTTRNRIARLNADGSLDATFNPGTGAFSTIHTIAIQSNGRIIIGGQFTSYNGTSRNYIARLNTDGTLDATFNPGTGASSTILTTGIQSDGKIIIAGFFTTYNGTTRNRIARLNTDGSLDATFDPVAGANSYIETISIQSDGKIIIGGHFTAYNGAGRNRIARVLVGTANTAPTDIILSNSSVAENQSSGTAIGSFTTTDADAGQIHTYTLVAGTGDADNASFTVVGNELRTTASFNFESKSSYTIRVRTTDNGAGTLTYEEAFTITVTDVNEAPTDITLSANTVAENQASGTAVGTFTTTDVDAGQTHTYALVAGTGDADNASFTIVGNELRTAASFNFESKSSYTIRVRTTDNGAGTLTYEEAFTITVTDVNEAPTDITLSNNTVAENQASGMAVGTFTTTDVDAGQTHTYTLVAGTGDADNASFTIVGNELRTAASFNFENKSSYTVRIRTTDNGTGGLTYEEVFTITVTDVNEAPTDITLSNSTVAENQASGTAIGTFTTTDVDAGQTHTYTLVSGAGDADNASFSIVGNELRTAASFNFESKSSYTIRVRTTDNGAGNLTYEEAFTITVTNVNEAPTDITLSNNTVAENQASGTAVGTFTTTDADAGQTHTYALVAGTADADNASFTIVGNELRTTASFNFESKSSYTIRVRTTDNGAGNLTYEEAFTITVTDVNEAPTDITLSNKTVAENQASGTAVGTFTTTDADAGQTHTYTLVSGTGDADNASFTIVGNELRTTASFNFENKSSYTIRVRTTDNGTGNLTYEEVFAITVTDANEGPTDITLSNNTVAENQATGTAVGTFTTTDVDAGQTHTYTLVTGTGDADNTSFAIVGNELRTSASFNFENKSSYTIRVRTTDNGTGGLTYEEAFTITVTDVNEAPVITSDGGGATAGKSVPEGTTAVTTVTATDPDAGSTITYSISGGADAGKFTINATTGALSFTTAPDFEAPTDADGNNTYIVTVRASDGILNDEQTITVTVTNNIDNPPVVTYPANGATINNKSPMYTGNAEASSTITVFVDGVSLGSTTADGGGNWSYPQPTPLQDGSHSIRVTSSAGSSSVSSNTNSFTVATTTLPVTLVNVKAYQKTGGIQVEWTTLTEINTDKFEVERSTDGQTFTAIGTVQAKGNSSIQQYYGLLDQAALSGSNYYRIKAVDKNGAVQYSNVVRVNIAKGSGTITVYPNPVVNNTISLQFANVQKGKYTVTLTNKLGQQLYRTVIDHPGGSSTQSLHITNMLPQGIYQLQVRGVEMKFVQQLIR